MLPTWLKMFQYCSWPQTVFIFDSLFKYTQRLCHKHNQTSMYCICAEFGARSRNARKTGNSPRHKGVEWVLPRRTSAFYHIISHSEAISQSSSLIHKKCNFKVQTSWCTLIMPFPPLTASFLRTRWSMVWKRGFCQWGELNSPLLCIVGELPCKRATSSFFQKQQQTKNRLSRKTDAWHITRWPKLDDGEMHLLCQYWTYIRFLFGYHRRMVPGVGFDHHSGWLVCLGAKYH